MKKYKLIKKYPTCLFELGDVVKLDNDSRYHNIDWRIMKSEVENYPEHWEEIIERDYEILQVKAPYTNAIWTCYKNKSFGALYYGDVYYCNGGAIKGPDMMANIKDNWAIHSIKRVGDGEVFTVGDLISFNDRFTATLKEIEFEIVPADKGKGTLSFIHNKMPKYVKWWSINQLSKITLKPLLTTEDGVDIFKGDKIYSTSQWKIWEKIVEDLDIVPIKWFSTKKAAEEYILMNKPCLSIKEVMDSIDITLNGLEDDITLINLLEKIVKSK